MAISSLLNQILLNHHPAGYSHSTVGPNAHSPERCKNEIFLALRFLRENNFLFLGASDEHFPKFQEYACEKSDEFSRFGRNHSKHEWFTGCVWTNIINTVMRREHLENAFFYGDNGELFQNFFRRSRGWGTCGGHKYSCECV